MIEFITSINTIAGSLIISALALLVVSILIFKRRPKLAIWVLFVSGLCLGFGFASIDMFIHLWDEQYHALVAKNLGETPLMPRLYPDAPLSYNYQIWVANHIWFHKPPFSLWQMAISIKLFGVNYLSIRLPSIIMHALLVFVIYRMGEIIYSQKTGFVAAIVFVFLNYPLELLAGLHTSEHVDVAFMFYITISLWCWLEYNEKKQLKWLIIMAVFSGVAILTKWLVGLLVYAGAGIVHLFFRENRNKFVNWRQLIIAVLVTVAIVLPWHIYSFLSFPLEYSHEMNYNGAHFYSVVESHGGDYLYYWDNLNVLYGNGDIVQWIIVISILSIPFFTKEKKQSVFVLTIILFPYLFFSLAATKMMSFCVIVSPLIILIVVGFINGLIAKFDRLLPFPILNSKVVQAIGLMLIVIFLLRPSESMKTHRLDTSDSKKIRNLYESAQKAIDELELDESKKFALSHANNLPEEMILWMLYKDNVIAYSNAFTIEDQNVLTAQGYTIKQIVWNGNTPSLKDY